MDVKFANVQDDAPTAVRAANVATIRGWAQAAIDAGHDVIAVTTAFTLIAFPGWRRRLRERSSVYTTYDVEEAVIYRAISTLECPGRRMVGAPGNR